MILADVTIKGRPRKVIMQANKNGFYYVIDRVTGQFISGQPYSHVTWAKGSERRDGAADGESGSALWRGPDFDFAGRRRSA